MEAGTLECGAANKRDSGEQNFECAEKVHGGVRFTLVAPLG